MLLIRFLRSLPAHVRTSFGTLNAFGPVGLADILTIYKAFHKAMSRRFGKSVQYPRWAPDAAGCISTTR